MIRPLVSLFALLLACVVMASTAFAAPACTIGTAGQTQRISVGETGRSMLIHIPAGFDRTDPAPLLFLLHGSTATGAAMLRDSRLEATSDAHGFILAAPDAGIPAGEGFVWNIPGVPTVTGDIPGPEDADDVAFFRAAIDWLAAQHCADPARVYATGLSGGGRMTSWLGCVASEKFAAIAPVVGLRAGNPDPDEPQRPNPKTCRPEKPLPVIAFAGAKDNTNPITGGGAGYWQYSMHAAEMRWAALNRCRAAPVTRWIAPGVYEERYSDCRNGADVVGRITVDGGHSWVVDNDVLWRFLSAHRRGK